MSNKAAYRPRITRLFRNGVRTPACAHYEPVPEPTCEVTLYNLESGLEVRTCNHQVLGNCIAKLRNEVRYTGESFRLVSSCGYVEYITPRE